MAYLLMRVLRFLPLIAAMVTANYVVDPAHVVHRAGYARDIASMMLSGRNVANATNFDDRLMNKYYIDGLTEPRDVVVLGSSRTMQINASMFPGRTFFNSSMTAASLADQLAVYQMYVQKGIEPSTVVLGLDPWSLSSDPISPHHGSVIEEYEAAMRRLGTPIRTERFSGLSRALQPYGALLSPSYLASTVRSLGSEGRECYATDNEIESQPVRLSDGSRNFGRKKHEAVAPDPGEVNIPTPSLPSVKPRPLDPELCQTLQAFIDDLLGRGIEVIIILPPFHPMAYAEMTGSAHRATIVDTHQYIRNAALARGLRVLGSFDPADLGFVESDFYDGTHPKTSAIARILRGDSVVGSQVP